MVLHLVNAPNPTRNDQPVQMTPPRQAQASLSLRRLSWLYLGRESNCVIVGSCTSQTYLRRAWDRRTRNQTFNVPVETGRPQIFKDLDTMRSRVGARKTGPKSRRSTGSGLAARGYSSVFDLNGVYTRLKRVVVSVL